MRSVGCERNHTRGTTRTRNFCKFCKTFVPVPETSLSSVRPWHNARGTGICPCKNTRVRVRLLIHEHSYTNLPGTSVSSVRLSYPSPEFLLVTILCSVGYAQNHTRSVTRARNCCKFCTTFIPVPGTCVSSVRPWHNTRGTGMPFHNTWVRVRVRVQRSWTDPELL